MKKILYLTEKHFRKEQEFTDTSFCPMANLLNESFPKYSKKHSKYGEVRYGAGCPSVHDRGTNKFGTATPEFSGKEFDKLHKKFLSGKKFRRKVTIEY